MPGTEEAELVLILIGFERYLAKYLYNLIFFIIKSEKCGLSGGLGSLGGTACAAGRDPRDADAWG